MQKTILMDKYPVHSFELNKDETNFTNVDEIIQTLKSFIDAHPVAVYITIFDHYAHTKSLADATIDENILDAKNLVFCFGKQIPTSKILAVRPRSIGVCKTTTGFNIDFMQAPNDQLNNTMIEWVESLAKN
jgi:hypothetical protein